MIITSADIKKIKPIADNISEVNRIEPYIKEAETLVILPAIGAHLYKQLDEADLSEATNLENNVNQNVTISTEEIKNILEGSYYDTQCKNNCGESSFNKHEGLISAVAYLAYSRMIKSHSVNVSAFGVVFKQSQFSEPVDEKTIFRIASETEKIGLEYLRQSIEYLKHLNLICERKKTYTKRKFKAIGD